MATNAHAPGAGGDRHVVGCCLVCGGGDLRRVFEGEDLLHKISGHYTVARCRDCGLFAIDPPPSAETLERHYPERYGPYGENYSAIVNRMVGALDRMRAARLRVLGGRTTRLLEVGCGDGRFLQAVREETGWEVLGTDMSETAVRRAAERGMNAVVADAEDLDFPQSSFDIVLMRHVIEHLRSPRQVVRKVQGILKVGGMLVLALPNAACVERPIFGRYWMGFDVPRHLFTFDVGLIGRLLASEGFSVTSVRHEGVPNNWIGSLSYIFGGPERGSVLGRMFTVGNPILLGIFLPLSLLQAAMRMSGRIEIVARKN
jgi:SAM-dependent methyltransferase